MDENGVDNRPVVETCDECGGEIHGNDGAHYGDDYYCFPDAVICEDCLKDYIGKFKVYG